MTMRPSASVLPISTVRPPYWVMTSPGRYAAPPTRVLGERQEPGHLAPAPRARGRPPARRARSRTPLMSVFIASMPSAGLMSRPPVSKVMPLPTRTTRGVRAVRAVGHVVELDQPRRGGGGGTDREQATEALGPQLALVPDPHVEPGAAGEGPGLGGDPGGVLGVGGDDGEVAGQHRGPGAHHRCVARTARRTTRRGRPARPASGAACRVVADPLAGWSSRPAPVPPRAPTARARDAATADRRHQRGVALGRAAQRRARGAQVGCRQPPATPTSSTRRAGALAGWERDGA